MGLKSIAKKAVKTVGGFVGGLLLACNIGCNSTQSIEANNRINPMGLEQEIYSTPIDTQTRVAGWKIPLNLLGGFFLSGSAHEGSHALATALMGYQIEDFCLPLVPNQYGLVSGYTIAGGLGDDSPHSNNDQQAFSRISGAMGDIALIETLNYNLRHGNVSREWQPLCATTSLMTRALLLNNVIQGLSQPRVANSRNDFVGFEYNSGMTVEQSLGAVGLYTLLNLRNIKNEFNTAIGRKFYPENKKGKACIEAIPTNRGIAIFYKRSLN